MLAMSDMRGRVYATVPGLAGRARVTTEQCKEALDRFKSPDEYSRSQEHEGRRIEDIPGGWGLLNYDKYRAMRDSEKDKERKRNWIAKKRAADRSRHALSTVDHGGPSVALGRPKTEDRSQKTDTPVGETQAKPAITLPRGFGQWAVATWCSVWKEAHGFSPDVSSAEAGAIHGLAKRIATKKGDVEASKDIFIEYARWYVTRPGFWAEKAHPASGFVSPHVINEFKAGVE